MSDTPQPLHLFIVPDQHRRWEEANGKNPGTGHQAGYERLQELLPSFWDLGLTHVTFWALSCANTTNRKQDEIARLTVLLQRGTPELGEQIAAMGNIRFRVVGDTHNIFHWRQHVKIDRIQEQTKRGERCFTLLVKYSGEWDLKCAIERVRREVPITVPGDKINPRTFSPTGFLPDVDLMIRTDPESRLSDGALPFQMINPRLYFTSTPWPGFSKRELGLMLSDFKKRQRRFGA